jgi:hypothetical protein
MAVEKERVDAYLATTARFEPDIAMTDQDAALSSIAISLKRIADVLEGRKASGKPGEPNFDAGTLGAFDMLCNAYHASFR